MNSIKNILIAILLFSEIHPVCEAILVCRDGEEISATIVFETHAEVMQLYLEGVRNGFRAFVDLFRSPELSGQYKIPHVEVDPASGNRQQMKVRTIFNLTGKPAYSLRLASGTQGSEYLTREQVIAIAQDTSGKNICKLFSELHVPEQSAVLLSYKEEIITPWNAAKILEQTHPITKTKEISVILSDKDVRLEKIRVNLDDIEKDYQIIYLGVISFVFEDSSPISAWFHHTQAQLAQERRCIINFCKYKFSDFENIIIREFRAGWPNVAWRVKLTPDIFKCLMAYIDKYKYKAEDEDLAKKKGNGTMLFILCCAGAEIQFTREELHSFLVERILAFEETDADKQNKQRELHELEQSVHEFMSNQRGEI